MKPKARSYNYDFKIKPTKNWIEIFPLITKVVINHFVWKKSEYVLYLMEKHLKDPKKVCAMWGIQFGETIRHTPEEKYKNTDDLYTLITKSEKFEVNKKYRKIVKSFYEKMKKVKDKKRLEKNTKNIKIDMNKFLTNYKRK